MESTWEVIKVKRSKKNLRGIKPVKLCSAIVRAASETYLEIIALVSESLETPASPTSYYFKHSNSCHASERFAALTLESGGSWAEPERESGS